MVFGLTALDCGAASLAMALGYHGREVTLEEVHQVLDVRQGTSAEQIIRAARLFGLIGQGVRAEVEDLDCLDPGTILHWEFDHFIVLEAFNGSRVTFLDPIAGRRQVPLEQFKKSFTGVALIFEKAPDFETQKVRVAPFRRYLAEVLRDHGLWARIVVTSMLLQLFSLALPLLTGAAVETLIPRADTQLALLFSVGLGAVLVCNGAAALVRGLLLVYWRTRLDARLAPGLLTHLLSLPFEYFQQRVATDLAMRLSSATVIRDGLTGGLLSGLLDGTLVLSYGVLVFWISPKMGGVVCALALAQCAVFALSWRAQRLRAAEEIAADVKMSAVTHDILEGVETTKAQGLEQRMLQQWFRQFLVAENAHVRKSTLIAWVDAISGTLRLASPLIVLMLGVFQVMSGAMSLGTMLALNAVAAGLFLPISNLVQTAQQLNALARHVERMNDVFVAEPEEAGPPRPPRALLGEVTLRAVSYRYSATSPLAVDEASLDCKPGELIALVGRSGSGKSTLAKLLAGLYRPHAGEVLYDGLTGAQIGLPHLRSQVGYVAQRPNFMGQSIRQNIANFDPGIGMDRVHAAARAAAVHEEILALPMGYETPLFEDGGSISGGQRQRIALARALVGAPKILILDEATSALDALTEGVVYDHLRALECTRVIVAHRLSTVVRADRIVVLDAGRVTAIGTHPELLTRCTLYRELFAAQSSS